MTDGPPFRELASAAALHHCVTGLAGQLSAAYPQGLVLVTVLKGGVPFAADLMRAITVDVRIEFLAISSYQAQEAPARVVADVEVDVAGRDVVVVEDLVDTGLSLAFVLRELAGRKPRSLAACALLDKPARRLVPVEIGFCGWRIGDEFVLGYGLDYLQRYRNLDRIVTVDPRVLRDDPDAYLQVFYPGRSKPVQTDR